MFDGGDGRSRRNPSQSRLRSPPSSSRIESSERSHATGLPDHPCCSRSHARVADHVGARRLRRLDEGGRRSERRCSTAPGTIAPDPTAPAIRQWSRGGGFGAGERGGSRDPEGRRQRGRCGDRHRPHALRHAALLLRSRWRRVHARVRSGDRRIDRARLPGDLSGRRRPGLLRLASADRQRIRPEPLRWSRRRGSRPTSRHGRGPRPIRFAPAGPRLVEPAVRAARDGFRVDANHLAAVESGSSEPAATPDLRPTSRWVWNRLCGERRARRSATSIRQPELAEFLERFGREGLDAWSGPDGRRGSAWPASTAPTTASCNRRTCGTTGSPGEPP